VLAKASGVLALASLAYAAVALARTRAFARGAAPHPARTPRVSVLKPLHGEEPLLGEKLRTFCDQDYPDYEVILGAREPGDRALAIARTLAHEFPDRVRVVDGTGAPCYPNPKANTLAGMITHARGAILAIVDSDMRVDRTWLRAIVAPFDDPHVGAVTCLYRGAPLDGLASTLGAMANHEHYAPSVLVAEALGPLRYCFGSTMAVRSEVFDTIGGLPAIGSHVADDAMLGELVASRGLRVELSRYVVENVVDEPTLRDLWSHELRWARTHRVLRPGAYAGLVLTYPLPLALLHLALARTPSAAAIAAAALGLRYALRASARSAFGVAAPGNPLLVPLRDVLGIAVWAAAFASPRIRWGDDAFALGSDGRLTPIEG
jgi:ceramide glucosyltransferase